MFPGLGSTNTNTSVTVPMSLNIVHNRTVNNFSVNIAHSRNESTNAFANVQNVGGLAGINYPTAASTDPQNWGVPRLSFTGFTGVFGAPATSRTDTQNHHELFLVAPVHEKPAPDRRRLSPRSQHGRAQHERARRVHVHGTLLGGRHPGVRQRPASSAVVRGLPAGSFRSRRRSRSAAPRSFAADPFDAYIEDNWQKSPKLTFNLGLRYELVMPYTEANGLLANLDAAPGFTSVAPVQAGGDRTIHGCVPRRA